MICDVIHSRIAFETLYTYVYPQRNSSTIQEICLFSCQVKSDLYHSHVCLVNLPQWCVHREGQRYCRSLTQNHFCLSASESQNPLLYISW